MQVTIIAGNLGGDPEMRYLPDGTAVTNFSVAVQTYGGKDAAGLPIKYAVWYRVSVFGAQAEAANQYLSKGQSVTVQGQLQADKETGGPRTFSRKDGSIGASFELRSDQITFGSRMSGGDHAESTAPKTVAAPINTDDIPF